MTRSETTRIVARPNGSHYDTRNETYKSQNARGPDSPVNAIAAGLIVRVA